MDGICPYVGPAIVFEAPWDVGGALRLTYRDPTIAGDVLTSRIHAESTGLKSIVYGEATVHPYSELLIVFDVRSGGTVRLREESTARAYLNAAEGRSTCPASREGEGVRVFSWADTGHGRLRAAP